MLSGAGWTKVLDVPANLCPGPRELLKDWVRRLRCGDRRHFRLQSRPVPTPWLRLRR